MKKIFFFCVSILSLFTAVAQNEKNIVFDANAEVRNLKNFTSIEVSGAIDLYLSQGNEEAVAVSASSNDVIERIRTEVKDGVLQIFFDGKGINWKSWGNTKMKAYVTFKNLTCVEASGACNVKTAQTIIVPSLRIEMSGASDFMGEVKTTTLKMDASGASNIRITGTTEKLIVDASGACNIKAYDLKSDICKIEASGASNIRVRVNKELSAEASGGSTIYFKGEGLIRNIDTSGGASVKRRAENE